MPAQAVQQRCPASWLSREDKRLGIMSWKEGLLNFDFANFYPAADLQRLHQVAIPLSTHSAVSIGQNYGPGQCQCNGVKIGNPLHFSKSCRCAKLCFAISFWQQLKGIERLCAAVVQAKGIALTGATAFFFMKHDSTQLS